jgi:TRAP-type C4-dicarboxylate transport system substrate-binding protein
MKQMVSLRMKKITNKILIAGVALLINASACSAEFDFIFQSLDPSGETNFQAQQEWADKLAQSSNGGLNVTIIPVGALQEADAEAIRNPLITLNQWQKEN